MIDTITFHEDGSVDQWPDEIQITPELIVALDQETLVARLIFRATNGQATYRLTAFHDGDGPEGIRFFTAKRVMAIRIPTEHE